MNNIPFISILIASYNYAEHLKKAIAMIRKSDFKDFEIVYCDDCSSDNSVEIIREIINENKDLQIRLIQNKSNMGILKTKTKLINECSGKYFMICDADDYIAEHCLDKLAAVAKKTDADRIVSEVYDIDENGRIVQKQDIPRITSKWLWNLNHGCLYKRSVFVDNEIILDFIPDDVCLTTYFSQYSKSVAWLRKPLYYWCIHNDSAGRNIAKTQHKDKVIEDFRETLEKIDSVSQKLNSSDIQQVQLLEIKLYYLQIFHALKDYSFSEKKLMYRKLKNIMKSHNGEYLNNYYIKNPGKMPLRKYAKYIILFSAFLEKFHLMEIGLFGYHMVSKVIRFDQ